MSRIIFLCALLITLLVTGCGPSSTPEPLKTPTLEPTKSDLPSPNGVWTMINMTHSGGIMGLMHSIEISSDGKYTVMDEWAKKTITRELSKNELSKLQEIISKTEFVSTEGRIPSGCADCFIYDLEIQGNGKRFSVQVDDVSMQKLGMETLIVYLRDLMDAALK